MDSSPTELGELQFSLPATQPDHREIPKDSETVDSDELVDDEWTKLYHQHSHHRQAIFNHNHSTTNNQEDASSRRSSPMSTSLRFSQQSTSQSHLQPQRDPAHKSFIDSWLSRRTSVQSPSATSHANKLKRVAPSHARSLDSKLKGKECSLESPDSSSFGFYGSGYPYDPDNLVSTCSNLSTSFISHESSPHAGTLHSQSQNNQDTPARPPRSRTSLLAAASDALGLRKKIGSVSRKKPTSNYAIPASHVMSNVIEISAHDDTTVTSTIGGTTAHKDREHEERERLRHAAAQSIGLDRELLHESQRPESPSSLDSPQLTPQPARIPTFPATLAALSTVTVMSSTLPKFTPPSSLLVFALSKQWKLRIIVLTSHIASHKTHVHLFKGAAPDAREVERLEKRLVEGETWSNLAGKDVGAKRKGVVGEESTPTMWFLQITDAAESQRWITTIKNAVLSQRSLRAGLGILAQTNGGHEPRGDMDVMLSMRLQGIIPTQPIKSPNGTATPPTALPKPSSPSPPPSLHSLRVNIPSSSPAAAIKGMFTGTRSRSPSVEGPHSPIHPQGHAEDSFGVMGNSLLTMLRTNATSDASSSPSPSLALTLPHPATQDSSASSVRSASVPVVISASDLKISKERDVLGLSSSPPASNSTCTPPGSNTPPTPVCSPPGALQPPPRKPKCASTLHPPASPQEQQGMYKQAGGNRSVAGSFGIHSSLGSDDPATRGTWPASYMRSVSPSSASPPTVGIRPVIPTGELSGTVSTALGTSSVSPNVNVRSASSGSWLCFASSDTDASDTANTSLTTPAADVLSHSTSITTHWPRQGVALPPRLTPPSGPLSSGPPPYISPPPESSRRASVAFQPHTPHPYAAERSYSSASSNSQSPAGISPRSGSSLSPTFLKRTSDSSAYSVSSSSTSGSRALAQIWAPIARSATSSFGSAGGAGGASRPMSLSGPVPVTHNGSAKRRSMPPPRPAPSFAPPPAPSEQGSPSSPSASTPSLQNPSATPSRSVPSALSDSS
ncbi:hypothetical protein BU15DRAFT_60286 [Melanogaster broomeanus]|nr:hypothetical protein BU15DRAFT_60286 [Melanogaster broomeanus]